MIARDQDEEKEFLEEVKIHKNLYKTNYKASEKHL